MFSEYMCLQGEETKLSSIGKRHTSHQNGNQDPIEEERCYLGALTGGISSRVSDVFNSVSRLLVLHVHIVRIGDDVGQSGFR